MLADQNIDPAAIDAWHAKTDSFASLVQQVDFIVPVLYVVIEKLAGGKKGGAQPAAAAAHGGGATAVAKGEHP